MTSRSYLIELQTVEACLTSALCAIRLAWRSIEAGELDHARTWTARAEASSLFAVAAIEHLGSAAGRRRLRLG